jgi:hypothetical protein
MMRLLKALLAVVSLILISAVPVYADVLHHREAERWGQLRYGQSVYDPRATPKDVHRNAFEFDHGPGFLTDKTFVMGAEERAIAVRCRTGNASKSLVGLQLTVNGKRLQEKIIRPTKGGRHYVERTWRIPNLSNYQTIEFRATKMNASKQHDSLLIDWWDLRGTPKAEPTPDWAR